MGRPSPEPTCRGRPETANFWRFTGEQRDAEKAAAIGDVFPCSPKSGYAKRRTREDNEESLSVNEAPSDGASAESACREDLTMVNSDLLVLLMITNAPHPFHTPGHTPPCWVANARGWAQFVFGPPWPGLGPIQLKSC